MMGRSIPVPANPLICLSASSGVPQTVRSLSIASGTWLCTPRSPDLAYSSMTASVSLLYPFAARNSLYTPPTAT